MKKTILLAAVMILSICSAPVGWGQFIPDPAQQLPMTAGSPPAPNVTVNYAGPNGPDNFSYFVVATYPRGVVVSQAATVRGGQAASASNPTIVSWNAVAGALSYDVLKLTNNEGLPASCTCRLLLATTGTTTTDTGAALQAYTLGTGIPVVRGVIQIDNQSQAYPFITVQGPQDNNRNALTPAISWDNGFATAFTTNGLTTTATRGSTITSLCTGTATADAVLFMPYLPTGTACTDNTEGLNNQLLVAGPTQLTNLRVLAGTGGSNASSGIVTVRRNGVNTGLSCTVGTGTTCSDTTDRIGVVAGDIITVLMDTEGGETLANVQVAFDW